MSILETIFTSFLRKGLTIVSTFSVIWTLMDGRNYFDGGYISTLQTHFVDLLPASLKLGFCVFITKFSFQQPLQMVVTPT
jgi:hypothetical protein